MAEAYSVREWAPLAALNTFRVAARARWLADLSSAEALPQLLGLPAARDGLMVLGEGSNLLFAADYPGLLLCPRFGAVEIVSDDDVAATVRAEAGAGWDALVDWTLARGLVGLENLALIPGLVGAAPIQNIGAYGAEVADTIAAVEAWDRLEDRLVRLTREQCRFGYRDSLFKRTPGRWIVSAVEFGLSRRAPLRLNYAGIREELAAAGVGTPVASDVAAAVRRLRRRKLPDPALIGNAGSFFKNPVVGDELAARLRGAHGDLPSFPAGPGESKLSAAWLIERCGWKGYREGDAGVADRHALVLVNHGNATGMQILELARRVAASVEERFGVRLEPEPQIVGAAWA